MTRVQEIRARWGDRGIPIVCDARAAYCREAIDDIAFLLAENERLSEQARIDREDTTRAVAIADRVCDAEMEAARLRERVRRLELALVDARSGTDKVTQRLLAGTETEADVLALEARAAECVAAALEGEAT